MFRNDINQRVPMDCVQGKEGVLLLESIAPCAAAVIGFGYLLFEMAVGRPPIVGELVSSLYSPSMQ